jgi:hypothetical protein
MTFQSRSKFQTIAIYKNKPKLGINIVGHYLEECCTKINYHAFIAQNARGKISSTKNY